MAVQRPDERDPKRAKPDPGFPLEDLRIRLVYPPGRADGAPNVEITRTVERPGGAPSRQRLEIEGERLRDLADLILPLLEKEKRREPDRRPQPEAKREETEERPRREPTRREKAFNLEPKPAEIYWPVVNVEKTLTTGAIVVVERTFQDRQQAELFSRNSANRATLSVPMNTDYKPGEKLVVAESEASAKLGRLIREQREFEREYGPVLENLAAMRKQEEARRWTGKEAFGKKSRDYAPGELVWSRTVGRTKAEIFSKIDEQGRERRTMMVTKTVRRKDGSLKEVATQHDPRVLLELYRQARATLPEAREQRERYRLGVWQGDAKPKKGQEVTLSSSVGVDLAKEKVVGRLDRVVPLGGRAAKESQGPPLYVVCEPTATRGVSRVLGFTKDRETAQTRMASMQRVYDKARKSERAGAYEQLSALLTKYAPKNQQLRSFLDRMLGDPRAAERSPRGQDAAAHEQRNGQAPSRHRHH